MTRSKLIKPFNTLRFITGLFFLQCLFNSTLAVAQSSVWKVEKNGSHIYLGGTLHLLTKSDYPLPGEFDLAYNSAEVVYFETDMAKLKGLKTSASVPNTAQSKTAKTLEQQLKPSTLQALKSHLKARQLPFERFKHYSPSRLYLTLVTLELARNDLLGMGVDAHFAKRARLDNKAVRQFETIDRHLSFLSKMAGNSSDQLILNGLKDMKDLPASMAAIKKIWRSGDREKYWKEALLPYQKNYPRPYKVLLADRNDQWMPKIEALFNTPEVEFILVGALHMIGPNGILQRLEAKGYVVKAL